MEVIGDIKNALGGNVFYSIWCSVILDMDYWKG